MSAHYAMAGSMHGMRCVNGRWNATEIHRIHLEVPAGPFSLAYKKRVYSANRIQFPLKRVDWDPNGERNPQNRGKSKYQRISWEEASTLIADEIQRIHKKYGPYAILMQGDGHGECKTINTPHGHSGNLLDHMGGFTLQVRNPDSWEGWYWGAKHVWGQGVQGNMWPAANTVNDCTEHSELMLFWGCDPETTPGASPASFPAGCATSGARWASSRSISVPDLNYGAAIHADKWIPILPNTDAALQLAIAHVWITENLYDKKYVRSHAVGMDRFAEYVLGEEDGIPKSPEWASRKMRGARMDHQSPGPGVRRPDYLHRPLFRRRLHPRPLFPRTCTFGGHSAGNAGVGRPGGAPASAHLLRHAAQGKPGWHHLESGHRRTPVHPGDVFHHRLAETGPAQVLVHKAIASDEPITFRGTGAIEGWSPISSTNTPSPSPKRKGAARSI